MSYFLIIKFTGANSTSDDIGIVLLMATPVLLILAFVLFLAGIVNKDKKPKLFKIAGITFLVAGISAIVGLGQCGWF